MSDETTHWRRFGEVIRQIREDLQRNDPRWTQEYVAAEVGISRQRYGELEGGSPTKRSTVIKIAKALQADKNDLLRYANFPVDQKAHEKLTALEITVLQNLQELPADMQEYVASCVVNVNQLYRSKRLAKQRERDLMSGTPDPDHSYHNDTDAPLDVGNSRHTENKQDVASVSKVHYRT